MAEQRSPKPQVMGSSPFWPEKNRHFMLKKNTNDIIIWCLIILITASSFYFFYFFPGYLFITRMMALLASFFFSFILVIYTKLGLFCWNYTKEAFKEVHLITWPSNKDTMQMTLVISGLVILMGILLCLVDAIFFNFIRWVANFG